MHSKLTVPSHKDILTIKCLCTLLRPFTKVSKQLSGQIYPTLPLVLPSLCGLEKTLRNRWIFDKVIHPFRKESYANETRVEMQRCRETLISLFTNHLSVLTTTLHRARCRRGLKRYLAEVAIDSDESDKSEPIKNPFDWWKRNQHKYRNLSRVGTVATSVASERAFSTGENIVTATRCSLAPDLVIDLVFIAENTRRAEHSS
ncbi:hypothetical protein PHMEG_00031980 [Phytophthora megakarya]|uniref:HAT C-terminal dimerisation domain-containing protein n=1 Tax=Phytophthora megakarya TaxID=4795 RepID=A0A225UVM0_9STRA|nr:hypothetical protein PHMEG_00031980 [Phytophthora megakarya]